MFLLLRNKQGLPVFSLQYSHLQLSANIPQCSDEHGRMGVWNLRTLFILRILLILVLFYLHQVLINLSVSTTILLSPSKLHHLWLPIIITTPNDYQGSSHLLMLTTPSILIN